MANQGKVDSTQVSIARLPGGAQARTSERVYHVTRQAPERPGGMQRFVAACQTALIKPNQTVLRSELHY
jgi:hypothetical protein